MNQRVKKLWIEALKSGDYQKGERALKDGDTFCCLGVLCDLYGKEKNLTRPWRESSIGMQSFSTSKQFGVLPENVKRWAGLKRPNPHVLYKRNMVALSVLNDSTDLPFTKIANSIEKTL